MRPDTFGGTRFADTRSARMHVQSAAVSDIAYDEKDDRLTVRFASGSRYAYFGVPPAEYRAFVDSDSKGRFFHHRILDRYPFARLN